MSKIYPVVETGMTDSGSLDNVLEFLVMAGNRSLPEAVMTMVPEAWQNDDQMTNTKKDFYRYIPFSTATLLSTWAMYLLNALYKPMPGCFSQ